MEDKDNHEKENAKFNMALDTLRRLGIILEQIKTLAFDLKLTDTAKQYQKINLVKQFFINASPLLPKEFVEKYQKEILNLKMVIKRITQPRINNNPKFLGNFPSHDFALEVRLDEILIEIQNEMQKEKYFMPPNDNEDGLF